MRTSQHNLVRPARMTIEVERNYLDKVHEAVKLEGKDSLRAFILEQTDALLEKHGIEHKK